jgi:hypothetical protein
LSAAVFWEQQGLQTFGQRIQITRPHASQPAFDRHFVQLVEDYGAVHAINLLGTKENEASLTLAYTQHLQIAKGALGDDLGITNFDFHNAVRIGGHDSVRDLRCVDLFFSNGALLLLSIAVSIGAWRQYPITSTALVSQ